MTAKTTVTITEAQTELGDLLAFYWVTVRLVHGGSGGSVDGHVVGGEGSTRFQLDDTGSGSFDVYPNSAISPVDTVYAVSIDGTSPLVVRKLDVPTSGPVDWADDAIQRENPSPPVTVPRAESGNAFDVLQVSADGSRYELAAPTGGADTKGADHRVNLFVTDVDMTGGSFTDVPAVAFGPIPRAYAVGATALVVTGDDLGLWTITASGPCTPGAALALGDVISGGIGEFAVAQSLDGSTITNAVRMADAEELTLVHGIVDTQQATIDELDAAQMATATTVDTQGNAIVELQIGAVPTSRTVNGHALSANVTVTASDVGAPSGSGTSSGTNTGDQTITLTGDVTGTGTGSFATTIGSSKVTSAMIVDGTIVNGDISASAAIAASKLSGLPWPDRAAFACIVWYPSTPPSSWTLTPGAQVGSGYAVTAATNDQSITYARLPLRAGTYALRFIRRTESACGIATFTLGGTSIGTIDCYSASNTNDVVSTITGITAVSADGFYDLVITNPTKNASAGAGYTLKPQVIDLYRTGA